MRNTRILGGAVTKNTSGSALIRHGDRNPNWEAELALCATFGGGAKALVLRFDGSPDNNTWFYVQSIDLTTADLDVVETKTISADCTRKLLQCFTNYPFVRVVWTLTSDNNATLYLDAVAGSRAMRGVSAQPIPAVYA